MRCECGSRQQPDSCGEDHIRFHFLRYTSVQPPLIRECVRDAEIAKQLHRVGSGSRSVMMGGMNSPIVDPRGSVQESYSARSREYVDLFGSIDSTHPSDRALVGSWAETLDGPVLDAGCGPGLWTAFLSRCGLSTRGIDLVPEFVEHASLQYPHLTFSVGGFVDSTVETASLGGIFAWYSLIHHEPEKIGTPLDEFARMIRPGGGLLVGFFEGHSVESFNHAVTTAYRWPVDDLSRELEVAGFEVIETHTRTGPGHRPHGAISGRRRNTRGRNETGPRAPVRSERAGDRVSAIRLSSRSTAGTRRDAGAG